MLAEVTDPETDPDRYAWHRGHATPYPDESVALELARSAPRARARGGIAAAAAFLERAAALSLDSSTRGQRALAAAQARFESGALDKALDLLAIADASHLPEPQRARLGLLRARIAYALTRGTDAPPLLLDAARLLEPHEPDASRESYLEALGAAIFAGRLLEGRVTLRDVAAAARDAPQDDSRRDPPTSSWKAWRPSSPRATSRGWRRCGVRWRPSVRTPALTTKSSCAGSGCRGSWRSSCGRTNWQDLADAGSAPMPGVGCALPAAAGARLSRRDARVRRGVHGWPRP